MRSLCLILLAVGAIAAPQASSEVGLTSLSTDSPVEASSPPAAGETTTAPPSVVSEKQPTASSLPNIQVLEINNITVIGVLDEKTKEEVEEIAEGFNRLRNLGVLDLEDEHFDEEGIEAGTATFKIKKLLKLAKIALIVLASQNRTVGNFSNMAVQMQQLVQLLNLRDSGVASNALEVVSAAQEQSNAAEQLAFEEEDATKRVAVVLAQANDTAVASLQGAAHGQVLFVQSGGGTVVMGTIVGLRPGEHQLSIYERGNCRVPGQRFDHSGTGESFFGTLKADDTGRATILLRSAAVALTGPHGVLGRTVLVEPVVNGRDRPQQVVRGTTYSAAGQFVPSLNDFLADDKSQPEEFSKDFSCGIIVRE